ncbi:MAG: tryptophan-rich sensory protein [Synechococcus sp.]|nr:tryptophan-rich sensory protein [Synechococcus sp.]
MKHSLPRLGTKCSKAMLNFNRDTGRQFLNLAAILAAFSMNVLANLRPLAGLTIAEISDQYFATVPIVPAGYAFAIWGLIYLGLISLGIYQALPSQRQKPHARKLGYALAWSSLAQILWVIAFQYQWFVLSLGLIIGVLMPLIRLYIRLDSGPKPLPKKVRWLMQIPVSIYFAWITVATIVNGACVLDFVGWQGWGLGAVFWTVSLLIAGILLAIVVTMKHRDIAYGGVFVWAWVAIAVKNWNQGIIPLVAIASALGLTGLCFVIWRSPQRLSIYPTYSPSEEKQ